MVLVLIKLYISHSIGRQHFLHLLNTHSATMYIECLKRVLHAAQRDRFDYSSQFHWVCTPVVPMDIFSTSKAKMSSFVVRTREIKVIVSVKLWVTDSETGGVATCLKHSLQTLFWMNPVTNKNFFSSSFESSI